MKGGVLAPDLWLWNPPEVARMNRKHNNKIASELHWGNSLGLVIGPWNQLEARRLEIPRKVEAGYSSSFQPLLLELRAPSTWDQPSPVSSPWFSQMSFPGVRRFPDPPACDIPTHPTCSKARSQRLTLNEFGPAAHRQYQRLCIPGNEGPLSYRDPAVTWALEEGHVCFSQVQK